MSAADERYARHDAHGAKADDGAPELLSILLRATDWMSSPLAVDDLKSCVQQCKVAISDAGAVGRSGDRAGDRDVRQRRKVVQRIAARIDYRREWPYLIPAPTVTVRALLLISTD